MEHQFRDSQKDSRTARYVWTALAGEAWKPSAVTTRDRARRTAWVSEARWGLGWQDHSWLHKAPGSCHQGTLEVQNVVGNLLVFFFFSLPPPLLWDQTKQAHQSDTACALHCQSAVCVWGQDHKTPLCAMASILVSSWLAGLQQQTDGPRQGFSSEELTRADCLFSDNLKQKEKNVSSESSFWRRRRQMSSYAAWEVGKNSRKRRDRSQREKLRGRRWVAAGQASQRGLKKQTQTQGRWVKVILNPPNRGASGSMPIIEEATWWYCQQSGQTKGRETGL